MRLPKSLAAWGTPAFDAEFKAEIEALDISQLPLVDAMTSGSVPLEGSVEVMIQDISEEDGFIRIKAGIFFNSMIAGCACADDPTPENENNEYCELLLDIDKSTATVSVILLNSALT